jgi:uncharacterized protein (DUF2164 family)
MLPPPDDAAREHLLGSIQRFFREELDDDIGELKARLVLDFLWKEAAPAAYNQGVTDAQTWMAERLSDLEGSVHADDSGYWS